MTMSHHRCTLKNADETNKIITCTDKCITPTDKYIRKCPCNVTNGVKTRSKTKNEPTVDYKEEDKYFAAKYLIY